MKVMAKDLKPKTDYYLTFDYWPKGGTKVRVSGMVPAKTIWSGQRGDAVKVKDTDGNEYFIHPKAWLFDQMPSVERNRDARNHRADLVDGSVSRLSYLRAPSGCASFSDTLRCCKLATSMNVGVVCNILGRDRYFTPNMNPNRIYDFNRDLIGEELLHSHDAGVTGAELAKRPTRRES